MQLEFEHHPVLLQEAIAGLAIQPDGVYVDGTFGRGGHSAAILLKLNEHGRLLAMDQDVQAVEIGRNRFGNDSRFEIVHSNFSAMAKILAERNLVGQVNGILLDLGVSSPQLDDASRGFSFMKPGPLDMRMDNTTGLTASRWIAQAQEREIADVIWRYGEDRFARRIARSIVESRQTAPIENTRQLADIISQSVPRREKHKHPATRTFQAIRIHINSELKVLSDTLPQIPQLLAIGGRLAVISFHSLEDRIVKRFMREQSKGPVMPPDLPVAASDIRPPMRLIGKATKPGEEEIHTNPRARSAVLRVVERIN